MKLEFKFDPNQDFQLQAIHSVVNLFHGLPRYSAGFALGDDCIPNLPAYQNLEPGWLHANLCAVQDENDPDRALLRRNPYMEIDDEDGALELEGVSNDSHPYPSFTVEMETGTGKTYVYLRTIYELRRHYGFGKFIVVVPSIAIYEGVVKHFEITHAHLAALYSNETVNLIRYDSARLSALRAFAASSFVEILVITLDAFNKKNNRIYQASEQLPGQRLPYQYLQATRPILILDEPQNMESRLARAALRTLHPLLALRYSATHRTTPNHLYCLTPFEAYRRNLVKKIQVDAVTERNDLNRPFLALQAITAQHGLRAVVNSYVLEHGRSQEAAVTLGQGDDLQAKTGRPEHRAGYVVEEIHAGLGLLRFQNGLTLHLHEALAATRPEVFRVQIEQTIRHHMQRQTELLPAGVKVLSLFFIDRVANYAQEDGLIRRIFDQVFDQLKRDDPYFQAYRAEQVHQGYFAQRVQKGGGQEFLDTESRTQAEREAEKAAFELIMRDKERLLSLDEPVCFIFAHSALKEGWDNPNVFQICTLNQTVSTLKKRQEIGRGLRLAVNQQGERLHDPEVNVLTVVANESYHSYAETLQNEYVEDGHATPPPKPTQVGQATARRNDALFHDARFQAFWRKLAQRSDYRIRVDATALVAACIARINNQRIPPPVIVVEQAEFVVTRFRLTLEDVRRQTAKLAIHALSTQDTRIERADYYVRGADLAKTLHEPRLRGFKLKSIVDAGQASTATFENGVTLALGDPYTFETQVGQTPHQTQVSLSRQAYPVFNLIERTAQATSLTRATVNAIFQGLSETQKAAFIENPEGFAAVFVTQIREALADHVVDQLEFVLSAEEMPLKLEEFFPPQVNFPQKELIAAGQRGLYDQVQIDSGVEVNFVQTRLSPDDKLIGYFKFPPAFRVHFPRLIGNYNPDWGILRYGDDGQVVLQLVRETKGSQDLQALQFPHERRKIKAARKHFARIGFDSPTANYRVVTDQTAGWWLPESGQESVLGEDG